MSAVLETLQHALGLNRYGQGEQYRDHFVAGPGHSDFETCLLAERDGLMVHRECKHVVGGHIFHVTEEGRKFVTENSPEPPRLTAGQKRYREWLDISDACGVSFGDWLKERCASNRADRWTTDRG